VSRTQPWLEGLGDWAWPGRAAEALPLPPEWVPDRPPALAGAGANTPVVAPRRSTARRLLIAALLAALATVCSLLALKGSLTLAGLGIRPGQPVAPAVRARVPEQLAIALPTLVPVSEDAAGSSIDHASFAASSLAGDGSFYVYLPPGFASSTARYPVIYLLHGQDGHADAFLEIGIQGTLDHLIATHQIPPMIAVMVQDKSTMSNWRNIGRRHSATYVVEVQELVDRMLPTVPARYARAIAGSSMGGFGAMHVALANPYRFSVVESWLGYFNHLGGELKAAEPTIRRLGLHAFLYGAVADPVALPEEDPAFATALRSAGAQASSAVYAGGHSLEKIEEHLEHGLLFAGRSLLAAERRAAGEAAASAPAHAVRGSRTRSHPHAAA
jgi:enterochelin esterase-like enzyme